MDCLFCRIIAGSIPSSQVYEDEQVYAFSDIDPQAPVHVLIVPRRHIASLKDVGSSADDKALLGHLHTVAAEIARTQNLTRGYRTVINTGPEGGQTVQHLHVHLLGGRPMHWPPG
jgi:histidine triad (HIT) family protein